MGSTEQDFGGNPNGALLTKKYNINYTILMYSIRSTSLGYSI